MRQEEKELLGFMDFFRSIPDHRMVRKRLHSVEEILLVTFCGVVAGCDGWEDIELFAKTKMVKLHVGALMEKISHYIY